MPKNTSRRSLTSSARQTEGTPFTRRYGRLHFTASNEAALSTRNFCSCRIRRGEPDRGGASQNGKNPHCALQPAQQLHDHEGGEKDGVRLGPEVPGDRAALPGGHVRNQEGESFTGLTHEIKQKLRNSTRCFGFMTEATDVFIWIAGEQ